ncbi:uncharacterized protein VTP21DRAFT_4238 [Calcarisporiella thermophila]|uniref:uncharacterized protein n=1 Tax=Calcarisporiella thermophila TaxID=911321 RepID=UPI003742EFA7
MTAQMDAQYEPLEVIGTGSFGLIRKIRRKSDNKILARKELSFRQMTDKERQQLVSEVNILRELRHPNIVRYYERFVDKERGYIYIIMEYCGGGDLAAVIRRAKKEGKFISEDVIWQLFTQIIMALHECHTPKAERSIILHRDLKPDNVFLDSNNSVKLGDFGLSRVLGPDREFAVTYVGTPYYMSPELINESSYNTKSDIWALGCLLFEMCALDPPFKAKSQAQLAARIKQASIPLLPPQYSQELGRVIKSMLQLNPAKRPATSDFFKLDRVRICVREREVAIYHQELKRREEEVKKREEDMRAREEQVRTREANLRKKEEEVAEREARVLELEQRRVLKGRSRSLERGSDRSINGNHIQYADPENSLKMKLNGNADPVSSVLRTPLRRKSYLSSYSSNNHSSFTNGRGTASIPSRNDLYPTAENLYGEEEELPSPFIIRHAIPRV